MSTLQEIARLVREELLTLIQPVQLLSVNPSKGTGEVSGRFRSSSLLFDYSIKGGTVRYRPVGAGGRKDSDDEVVDATSRLDARKPRNCVKGFSCGNTCIQQGRTCRAKGGQAAAKLAEAVKMLPAAGGTSGKPIQQRGSATKGKASSAEVAPAAKGAAKGPGKAPSLAEARGAVLGYFEAKTVAALKRDKEFQMAMAGDENPLKSKEDWMKLYRRFIKVPENERNLPDGPTVVNGIDVLKNFRPWAAFGLNPKTATADDVKKAFRKTIMKHHPDQGGDPRVAARLTSMKNSLLALMPDERKGRVDSAGMDAEALLGSLLASRQQLAERRNGRINARRDGYLEALERLDARAQKKNCKVGYSCGNTCISTAKECVKPAGASASRLGVLGGRGSARTPRGTSQNDRRIAALTARRDAIGKSLVADLSKPRPDGMGNYIENPDGAAMKRIKAAGQRVAKIDQQLNILEGKDPGEKRWVEGDPYGLSRYSDFQSPGRKAYEQKVIAKELQGATKGDQAVFMSGGPASGKTSLLRKQFGEAEGFAVIDPDRIKGYDPVMEIGVAMGMRQAAALAHENSSRLSKELFATARDQNLNLLMDGTGANAGKYINQMQELKGRGYQVTLLAQHVPEEVGVQRAVKRAEHSGRFVPLEFIQHAYEVIPGNFERLAQVADRATLNDGESNQVIMSYEGGRLVGGDRRRTADYRKRYGKP